MSAHKYELMFIADPELDERGLKKLTEQYLETVTKEGGAVENIDIWGRRKLAYEIAGKERLWCITESDRSVTTLLLPSEY